VHDLLKILLLNDASQLNEGGDNEEYRKSSLQTVS